MCTSVYTQCTLVYAGTLFESFNHGMIYVGRGASRCSSPKETDRP